MTTKLADIIPFPPRFASAEELERHEREVREAAAVEERRRRRDAWALVEATIPALHDGCTLDAPWLAGVVGPKAIERARTLLQAPRLVFLGPTGAGKSSLAVAMLRARRDLGARFAHCARLGQARIQHRAGDGEAPAVEDAIGAKFAVLDELGGERLTQVDAVPDVVFERHLAARPTWFTTGLTAEEISGRYGAGVTRRIFEGAEILRLGASGKRA